MAPFLVLALLFSCQEKKQKPEPKAVQSKNIDSLFKVQVDLEQINLNQEAT